jgi:DNA-binding beta-propeller fold protein YncE
VLALTLAAAPAYGAPFAYVTSADTPDSDAVSQYNIGLGGLLAPLSPPTVAAEDPIDVAVSPDGRSVYVTNANSSFYPPFFDSNVGQYDVGGDGALSPKDPPTVSAPGGGPDGGAGAIALTPDGRSAYVLSCDSASFAQYDVAADGTLSPKDPPYVGADNCPSDVAVSPDGESAYVTNRSSVVVQYDIGADGALSYKDPPVVHTAGAAGVVVSPDSGSVYVAGDGVSQYDVAADGTLSPKDPPTVGAGKLVSAIAVSPDGRSVYVAGSGVRQYDVGGDGALSPKDPRKVAAGERPAALAVSADGRSVYVANRLSDDVSQYDVGPGGTLSPKSPVTVAAGDGPSGVAVSPSPNPTGKAECKHGGWRRFGFGNQGRCIRSVKHA